MPQIPTRTLSSTPQEHLDDHNNAVRPVNNAVEAAVLAGVKGDVLVYNGTVWARLPVGTNGQVLTADSAEATGALWRTIAAYGGTGLILPLISTQTYTSLVATGLETGGGQRRYSVDLTDWSSVLLTGGVTTSGNNPSYWAPLYSTDSAVTWKYFDGSPFRQNSSQDGGSSGQGGPITVTADASTNALTMTNASSGVAFANGERVQFAATSTGALPAPLAINTVYFVVESGVGGAALFKVATTQGGTAIDLTSAGTATIVVFSAPPADNKYHLQLGTASFQQPMGTTYQALPSDAKAQILVRVIAWDGTAGVASASPAIAMVNLAFKR